MEIIKDEKTLSERFNMSRQKKLLLFKHSAT